MSNTIDNVTLRVAYERGAEARWREGFPENMSITDMERAAHTAGLREVLRLVPPLIPPPPMPCEEEIEKIAGQTLAIETPGIHAHRAFANQLWERFRARLAA
jgi:hypothetical protein